MNIVLLSGGSGKRLWPLSNGSRSKQFLRVLEDEDGNVESMVQRVWKQLKSVNLSDSAVIATSESQVEMIHNQIGVDTPVIIEPERRDTFPAIALAATYLYSVKGVALEEVVSILPVDPYVQNEFFERVNALENILIESKAELALIGVQPTYPSTKYGYITPSNSMEISDNYLKVNHFTEKPTEVKAKDLIKKGSLWNCGVFAFKLEFIISILIEKGLPTQYNELLKKYEELPMNSFDYEIVERAKKIITLPYEGYWKDLGTWNTLTEEMAKSIIGKGVLSKGSKNTHIVNELDIPITVIGIKNAIVASSPDGILVADKQESPKIKSLLSKNQQRPMYEERRWGWYKVIDYTFVSEGHKVLTKKVGINIGENLSYQSHQKRSGVWTIIKGEGLMILDGNLNRVEAGDVVKVPIYGKYAIKAITDLELIEVQSGTELIEEDTIVYETVWGNIEHKYAYSNA